MLFIFTAIAYAAARIMYSLGDLGDLLWYGVIVFVVEMLGASSIVFYGVWLIAKPDNSDIIYDGAMGSNPKAASGAHLRRRYSVRVLIPCYQESLAIVRRTVMAAFKATIPIGCNVTIYLCGALLHSCTSTFFTAETSVCSPEQSLHKLSIIESNYHQKN